MSALTHPLSVADGRLWLGAPPVAGGRGIALTTDGVVLHDLDVDPTTIPWSEVTGLEAVVEVSRWRRPAVASWTFGLLGAALDVFTPGVPDDVGLRIETAAGTVEHAANAHNRGGYPRDEGRGPPCPPRPPGHDADERGALAEPDAVRDAFDRAADEAARGDAPRRRCAPWLPAAADDAPRRRRPRWHTAPMADPEKPDDGPSLEMPSFSRGARGVRPCLRRRPRARAAPAPEPERVRRPRAVALPGVAAALLVGLAVGLAAVLLGRLLGAGCEAVRGTSACGGAIDRCPR